MDLCGQHQGEPDPVQYHVQFQLWSDPELHWTQGHADREITPATRLPQGTGQGEGCVLLQLSSSTPCKKPIIYKGCWGKMGVQGL